MIDLIALSAAKKHADLLAMGLTSVSVDNTNKSITFTLAADGSQRTIYFDQPSDGISIVGIEIKNGHLICLMSDGSEIDAGVLPSGGSGGSVPKPLTYDYMPEGYPSKAVQTVTLLEEQEVAFSDIGGIYAAESPVQFELTEGETYTVVWDGVEYKCVCYVNEYIGNPAAFELEATGEPFVYAILGGRYTWGSYDTATTHAIGVTTSPEIITPMSYDYMPEGYPKKRGQSIEWNGNTEGLVFVLEMLYKVSDLLPTYDELIGSTVELSNGKKVKITSDCIRAVSEDITFIGKDDLFIAVVKKDNAIFEDTTFPQKGTYFAKQQNIKAAQAKPLYVKKLTGAITPMAEEFLPPRITEAIDAIGTVATNAQSTATNAQSTANDAHTTASNAKATATNAQTTATNAQTTANAAKTTADTAKETANAAKTTADTAKETANAAKTTADTAKETANAAKTAADTAKETANAAKTAADTAKETANAAKTAADTAKETANASKTAAENAVKYTASQNLTDAQKEQARTNIGAGTSSFSGSWNDLTGKPLVPTDEHINELINTALNAIGIAEEGAY